MYKLSIHLINLPINKTIYDQWYEVKRVWRNKELNHPQRLLKPYLLLLPCLLFVFLFIGYGVFIAVRESVQGSGEFGTWTLYYYQELFNEKAFWDSLFLSLQVTFSATMISLIIGIILTRFLYHYFLKNKWKIFVWIPMLIPHFVAGYLVLFFFTQSGWISSLFFQVGLLETRTDFPVLVLDQHGIGMILTYVWKEVPFVVLMLLPVYYQLDPHYSDLVRTLHGGRWQVFKTAEWPWLLPVVIETGLILFAFIIAAFEVPFLLGVTYPQMLPVLSYEWFFGGDWSNRPLAMAAMVMITAFVLVLSWIGFRLTQNQRYKMMRGS